MEESACCLIFLEALRLDRTDDELVSSSSG